MLELTYGNLIGMDAYIGELFLVAVLIVLNGYFAAAEIALVSARRAALKADAEDGSSQARAVLKLTSDPSRFLAATQVGITLVGFGASATAAVSLARPIATWLKTFGIGWVSNISAGLSVFLVTVVISYLTLVFGELAPKRLGLQRAESVAKSVAGPITVLQRVTAPLIWVLSRSTDAAARILGVKPGSVRPGVTEEEIKLLVTEQGTLLDEEKRMIHEIFALGDTVAKEVMVPRVDAVMLEDTATIKEAIELFRTSGYSRLPVYSGDPDSVVGILLLKDLVGPASAGSVSESVTKYARPAVFVPETKPILAMLSDMQRARNHLAVVVDEYGGTAGLVTIEDIVEEIIGEVADEFDRERRYITTLGPDEWVIDGLLSVEEARDLLDLDVPESEEYETVAGWVLMELGHIPVQGEIVAHGDLTVRVELVRRRRISRLRVSRGEVRDEGGTHGKETVSQQ
ncbi:MAG: hemolysin family protein [Actinomycetota bacterium]|nr:hemolysin family protein [Actinomycetota bacterium]MDP3630499.1 hemolysin family protein [Actinomycetota bacterium]